jgi:hypothetical protein
MRVWLSSRLKSKLSHLLWCFGSSSFFPSLHRRCSGHRLALSLGLPAPRRFGFRLFKTRHAARRSPALVPSWARRLGGPPHRERHCGSHPGSGCAAAFPFPRTIRAIPRFIVNGLPSAAEKSSASTASFFMPLPWQIFSLQRCRILPPGASLKIV